MGSLPTHRSFSTHTDVIDAYNCTRGLHKHRKRQSVLTVDWGVGGGGGGAERERFVLHRKRQLALREREREGESGELEGENLVPHLRVEPA